MLPGACPPDATLGEGNVLGHPLVQVVTHHQHVQVLVDGVEGVWSAVDEYRG